MPQRLTFANGGAAFDGLSFVTVKSDALRGRADITLFVAPQVRRLRDVPLVLLLHGAHGAHWNWSVMGAAHRTAQRLMADGSIPPLVLAMPSDGLWGDGSGYLTHPEQDFEKWIVEEVPAAARGAAICLSERSPVFFCGLSMGGFAALRLGAKYPHACRGMSAHSSITHFTQLMKYVAEPAEQFRAPAEDYSVLDAMRRNRETLPPFRFDCGLEDELLEPNRQLHRDLEEQGITHTYEEFSGGHNWIYWQERAAESLRFFAGVLGHVNQPA